MAAEVTGFGVVAASDLHEVLAAVRSLAAGPELPLCLRVRTYRSLLKMDAGLQECTLHCMFMEPEGGAGWENGANSAKVRSHTLCCESVDPLPMVARPRKIQCLQARRSTRTHVSQNADSFLEGLLFQLSHETWRKGYLIRHGQASISIFQLHKPDMLVCDMDSAVASRGLSTRPDSEAMSDTWLVELQLRGTELKELVADADEWADLLESKNVELLSHPFGSQAKALQ